MRQMASESCFYTREKQVVAFDWLEREAKRGFGGAMKDNRDEPFCTQASKIVWGKVGGHHEGWKTLKNSIHGLFDKILDGR
ncbi:hypothetical protein TNCV_2693421 [Trichonephila clavipes]|nr:hypothetical protein TNCV_2693421 [Trichonephila clavipes]